jgi:Holliday junction resolvase
MNSRDKGKRGEREWARVLKETFGLTDARRGVQYAGSALSPDVVGSWPNTHPEVKRVERFDPQAWIEQAVRDAAGKIPYVAHRQNNKPWLVTVRADDLIVFAKAIMKNLPQ